ncbi:hypothetical protein EJ04DRAFT_513306 [Polyplosphaeria fusca]|uniref:HAUS augmin-like complex subunit 6 N-terminal domain-containing protein n=1 Tax=Polyplosphaeria fusca TaxID=682080 RepID=A0A9P4QY19_9PLEO|nr:hypothetical protein EJ04DRAFT_513306 [Polyplosphaeria fusca]
MSRSTSYSSSILASATNGPSRALSVRTNAKHPSPASDAKLFVTNLRLLDLDLRSDWPNITPQTLSSRNADQKQRISAVEWALFRLFELWDPHETSQKLQPFFPPLEPLQSLNLRAALYRCLNELKKIGVLGRESVLRKTMLDDCKGDRFYEVLQLFSTAVLKKLLAAQKGHKSRQAVARTLATATGLPTDAQASLLPLAIAHKAALVNLLKRKEAKRRAYLDFANILDAKAEEIHQRNKRCMATPRSRKPSMPQKEAEAIKKQLQQNWVGDRKWLDAMIYGDDAQAEDAFLKTSFKHVWRMVETGRRIEDAGPEIGLLENLQMRVDEQKSRLARWKRFSEEMHGEVLIADATETKPPNPAANEFIFNDHFVLQLKTPDAERRESFRQSPLRPDYQHILSDMDQRLLHASQARYNRSAAPVIQRRASSFSASHGPQQRRKSRSDSASKSSSTKPNSPATKHSKEKVLIPTPAASRSTNPLESDITLVGNASTTTRNGYTTSRSVESLVESHPSPIVDTSDPLPTATSPPHPTIPPPRSPSPPPSSYYPSEPPVLAPPPPEEALADQIISSIDAATPSPIKKPYQPRMSLVERTRMSMARNSMFQPVAESPVAESPLPELPEPAQADAQLDRRASLLERTRLSMAAMSAQPRTQPKRDKRKSKARESIFPVNQFDTPRARKSFAAIEEQGSGEHTPKEDLFSDQVDYDRVFKSRPRIAQSPIFSTPVADLDAEGGAEQGDAVGPSDENEDVGLGVYEYDEGVTGVDLDDVDQESDEEGFTQALQHTPSRLMSKEKYYEEGPGTKYRLFK